jgi:glycosyltransferase involved in cell wall biosynthesis
MKIGFAGPASLHLLADHVHNGQAMPSGYEFPPMSLWTLQLLARGHRVVLFTHAQGVTRPQSYFGDRLTIHIGRQRARGKARDFFALERRDMVEMMKADPCDIIHANWTYEFALAALDSGQPVLVTAHDAPLRALRYFRTPYRFMRLCMAWRVARRAPYLTAVSQDTAGHIRRYLRYKRPIAIVPNALASEDFELGRARKEHPHHGAFTVASVLTGWKGLKNGPAALKAFGILRRSLPDAHLLLFGHDYAPGGPAETWARQNNLTAGVEFAGPVPNRSLLRRLAREADVLLHPALEESFGMAVAEAMALGLPVVGGKHSGAVPALLDYGRAGELVDVRSPSEISDSLALLAADSTRRQRLGVRAFESALERFNSDVVFEQYEEIYMKILNESNGYKKSAREQLIFSEIQDPTPNARNHTFPF